jgi:hypothetical protein
MTMLTWSRRKTAAAVLLCAILVGSSIAFWQMNQNAQAAILNPQPAGLVGWWKFDEGSGTVAKDSSGNGNDGTIFGAVWGVGKYGQALDFDGVSSYVSVPNDNLLSAPANLTFEAWFKVNSLSDTYPASYQQIVGKQGYLDEYRVILVGNTVIGQIYDASNEYTVNSGNGGVYVQTGVWYQAVMTYDKANLRLFVNGVLVDALPLTVSINPNTNPLFIGINSGAYYPFNGTIDDVRIYSRALSESEIQGAFQHGPEFSSNYLAKIPEGVTQVIVTLAWQGVGDINTTIVTPAQNYTESMIPVYQKTSFSTAGGSSNMVNIKRLSVAVTALPDDQDWYISLSFDSVTDFQITVETQK